MRLTAVVRIPTARAISGHEKCQLAPNGAPDCVAAANTMCKAKGFGSGKSLDMTTAEVCPAKVYMSGRSTGPECTRKRSSPARSANTSCAALVPPPGLCFRFAHEPSRQIAGT